MPHTAGNREFLPLLLGGDINVYSMARAFDEAYGMVSAGYGLAQSGVCLDSRILNYQSHAGADQEPVLKQLIGALAAENPKRKLLLLPVGDNYVRSLAAIRHELPANVLDFGITPQVFARLTDKARFYDLCQRYGMACPDTHVLEAAEGIGAELERLRIELPWVLKPTDGVAYWQHPFAGQEKVHFLDSRHQAQELVERIYAAGYPGQLVLQEYIPGDDTHIRVLTTYSSQAGQVLLSCMGQVLLEEHTPRGKGNHALIISSQDPATEDRIRDFLQDFGYTGPANFDFKLDRTSGQLKILECNTRQGRSNYYVTASGVNLAQVIAEDLVYQRRGEYLSINSPALWLVVPRQVAFDYTPVKPYHAQMRELFAQGRAVNPLLNPRDNGVLHRARAQKSLSSQPSKFQRFYQREQM